MSLTTVCCSSARRLFAPMIQATCPREALFSGRTFHQIQTRGYSDSPIASNPSKTEKYEGISQQEIRNLTEAMNRFSQSMESLQNTLANKQLYVVENDESNKGKYNIDITRIVFYLVIGTVIIALSVTPSKI
jgi:hypothetical protein